MILSTATRRQTLQAIQTLKNRKSLSKTLITAQIHSFSSSPHPINSCHDCHNLSSKSHPNHNVPRRVFSTSSPPPPSNKFQNAYALEDKLESTLTALSRTLADLEETTTKSTKTTESASFITCPMPSLPTYHLPRDLSKLTISDTIDMATYFSSPPYNKSLHPYYFGKLLAYATDLLEQQPAVNYIPFDDEQNHGNTKIHVVGDLHGSLPDLITILNRFGYPSATNTYVFNGDFVDRGLHSTEVLSILLALLIQNPNHVYLTRGNHEDVHVATAYGFRGELESKYGADLVESSLLWEMVGKLFAGLPLACVIPKEYNGGAFVVHAGVGEGVDIGDIRKGPESVLKDEAVADLVWSDPDFESEGARVNDTRGGTGKLYGMDVISKFLSNNSNYKHFIRSHQQMYDGVQEVDVNHSTKDTNKSSKFWTVFSVTDYPCSEGFNRAGVLTFYNNPLDAAKKNNDNDYDVARENRVNVFRFKSKAIDVASEVDDFVFDLTSQQRTLFEEISMRKAALEQGMLNLSKDGKTVTVDQWKKVMQGITGLHLDWDEMQPLLSARVQKMKTDKSTKKQTLTTTNTIRISHFLSNFDNDLPGAEKHFQKNKLLYMLFAALDADKSGGLTIDELLTGMKALNGNLKEEDRFDLDRVQADFFDVLDTDGNGIVDLEEWRKIVDLI